MGRDNPVSYPVIYISYRAAAVTEDRLPQARVSFKARTPPRGSVSVSSTG